MSGNHSSSSVTADYAQRVADDLAANLSDQERVRAELARLQEELVRLEESQQVLTKMQDVLGATGTSTAKNGKGRKRTAVPAARRSGGRAASRKAGTAPAGRKASGKTAAKKGTSPRKPGEPTWRELITAYLAGEGEPRSATEVAAGLTEAHPERTVQVTVVRNTLEQGVAQGLLERSKQGRSVFYSAVSTVPAQPDA
ncbi:hypothetical protein [Streptomyces sp. NPDC059452]|uniref:hypothetical protein n=1 Tax=Streptomyces sp. NPDC059452 TaxID=3346835 RepID=UPI0036CE957B